MLAVPNLDTLRLCSLLNTTAFGVLFLFLWFGRRSDRYFLYWAASALLYGAVIVGFDVCQGNVWLTGLLLAALGFSNLLPVMGLRSLEGRPIFERWMASPMLVLVACHALPRLLGADDGRIAGGMEALGLAGAMAINGSMLAHGPSRGQRVAGGAMLAYLPAYAAGYWAELRGLPPHHALALMPMLADQVLLGILNLGLVAIPFDRAQQTLQEAVLRDPLTGVFNRAGLDAQMGRLLGAGAALIAIDVDHFKRINDAFGHQAGDDVLVAIAQEADRLAKAHHGVLGRLGGDEFVMLLPAGCESPIGVGEALKANLRPLQNDVLAWSVSMGVATLEAQDTFASALTRADKALYRAKEGGRNRLAA